MQMGIQLDTVAMIISLIASFTAYFKYPALLYLRLFPIFLGISLGVQLFAPWLVVVLKNNSILFNFYAILNFSFYLFVLGSVISNKQTKNVIFNSIWIFVLLALCNLFFLQGVHHWNSLTYSVGCLLIIAFCIYYFLEIFRLPNATKLYNQPAFWIITGFLFFYACSFPFLGLANFLSNEGVLIRNLSTILIVLTFLMYLLFAIGFIVRIKFKKNT